MTWTFRVRLSSMLQIQLDASILCPLRACLCRTETHFLIYMRSVQLIISQIFKVFRNILWFKAKAWYLKFAEICTDLKQKAKYLKFLEIFSGLKQKEDLLFIWKCFFSYFLHKWKRTYWSSCFLPHLQLSLSKW